VVKSKDHEATTTDTRDNQLSEARCEAIKRMVSEPPGCNESERNVASKTLHPEAEPFSRRRRQYEQARLESAPAPPAEF